MNAIVEQAVQEDVVENKLDADELSLAELDFVGGGGFTSIF